MFRLTREVRMTINAPGDRRAVRPTNTYAAYPTAVGWGQYLSLQVTLAGEVDPSTGCVIDIKAIDAVVRERAIPVLTAAVDAGTPVGQAVADVFRGLGETWPAPTLAKLSLSLSPFLSVSMMASEGSMVRYSQKFEFSASHRLHNPNLPDDENRRLFGKCNNPLGHGHNYEIQVTVRAPAAAGLDLSALERTVNEAVVDRFDHRYLNEEIAEFAAVMPSVENIARVAYALLKPRVEHLASVTVWETGKTSCEYSE
jgi:6-pyruvoyltetrahydropterin/6-carboxytetrahydropterin synthase